MVLFSRIRFTIWVAPLSASSKILHRRQDTASFVGIALPVMGFLEGIFWAWADMFGFGINDTQRNRK